MKPGFYFLELVEDYGTFVALVHNSGLVEKFYLGNHPLLNNFLVDKNMWYKADNRNLDGWEYIGL